MRQFAFRAAALAGLLQLPFPSTAEDLWTNPAYKSQPSDMRILRSCVEEKRREAAACVDLVADDCADQPSDDPRELTLMNCWSREYLAWDQLLNERYAVLVTQAKEQDAAPGSYTERESYKTLQEAQRAWIAFRDAELGRFWMMRAPGLSWWRAADLEHLRLRLTATRYLDLLTVG